MKLKYFAWIKEITNTHFEEINDESIKDINSLINFIIKKYPKLNKYFKKEKIIRIAINLEYISSNRKIFPNDEIAFFPPVSGG
jgi:molybdopterin synthase sulfur carrier subunit